MADIQLCVRLRKCENIPSKWNDSSICIEMSLTTKSWKSPAVIVRDGIADWTDVDNALCSFSKPDDKKKLSLSFKLKTASKDHKVGISKWTIEFSPFVGKTDPGNTVLRKGGDKEPRLTINVVDTTALARQGKIPASSVSQSLGEPSGVQKKKRRLSARILGLKVSDCEFTNTESVSESVEEEAVTTSSSSKSSRRERRKSAQLTPSTPSVGEQPSFNQNWAANPQNLNQFNNNVNPSFANPNSNQFNGNPNPNFPGNPNTNPNYNAPNYNLNPNFNPNFNQQNLNYPSGFPPGVQNPNNPNFNPNFAFNPNAPYGTGMPYFPGQEQQNPAASAASAAKPTKVKASKSKRALSKSGKKQSGSGDYSAKSRDVSPSDKPRSKSQGKLSRSSSHKEKGGRQPLRRFSDSSSASDETEWEKSEESEAYYEEETSRSERSSRSEKSEKRNEKTTPKPTKSKSPSPSPTPSPRQYTPKQEPKAEPKPEPKIEPKPEPPSTPQPPPTPENKNEDFAIVLDEEDATDFDITYKVIIIGDTGVGKTGLLNRWHDNSFATKHNATITCELVTKSFLVKDQIIRVQFWDTAGQERYKSMTRQYYKGCHGAVLVYGIEDAHSFRSVKRWMDDVLEINNEALFVLVGNKSDLTRDRRVTMREAQEYADDFEIDCIETSAKDGTNCVKAMRLVLQNIHNNNAGHDSGGFSLGGGESEEGDDEGCC
eukprot:TRINITY_DN10117_c0_g1_i1.p1 TRINITY_DN10117_c0_g1~~TRINITY_DN10117_c0_g1_i1.p1  ORF type:complete len:712 (+),score=157.06 TRINITY_DN10117_c0_g1_i1:17-2152(+)